MSDSTLTNTQFGQYQVQDKLGTGGMASVYRAVDTTTQEMVALKILHTAWAEHVEIVRRFNREAEIANRLRHPHIVTVKNHGLIENRPFLAMTYMPGGTLAQRFKEPVDISPQYVVRLLRNVGSAFDYAHRQGIIHRDLKLENILLSERGDACLSDFGVARVMDATHYTASGNIFGTPLYMSPEQASGRMDLDYRADLYSLAVVAYLLVVGRFPFIGTDMLSILNQHLRAEPPIPSEMNPKLPPAIDLVLLRGLAKNPADRYPSADMFIESFAKVMSEKGPRTIHIDLWSQVAQDSLGEQTSPVAITADDWYELARKAATREQAMAYLRRALQADPLHSKANRALMKLEREKHLVLPSTPPPSLSLPRPQDPPKPSIPAARPATKPLPNIVESPKVEQNTDLLPEKKRTKQIRKRRSIWTRVSFLSFILLIISSFYFVISFLGLNMAGRIAGFITGQSPAQEINGIPIEQLADAPLLVPPSSSKEAFSGSREVDILQSGYNHEFVFSANSGENMAIYVQFISLTAKNAPRNVAIINPFGEDGRDVCNVDDILQDGSGVVYDCDINISGAWKVRIFGREGESSGAYFFSIERLEALGSIPMR
jgi:serine/threonine protein kinase